MEELHSVAASGDAERIEMLAGFGFRETGREVAAFQTRGGTEDEVRFGRRVEVA